MKTVTLLLAAALALSARAAEPGQRLEIDHANSLVDIMVKATVDSFTGTLDAYTADIRVDPEGGRVLTATFNFQFADVKTGKEDRDAEMHEWQETERFPSGSYRLTALTRTTEGNLTATGDLTFHGVTRTLTFPVAVTTDRQSFAIDGEVGIDTRDFGLPVIRKFLVLKVDPVVQIRFHLQGDVAAN